MILKKNTKKKNDMRYVMLIFSHNKIFKAIQMIKSRKKEKKNKLKKIQTQDRKKYYV